MRDSAAYQAGRNARFRGRTGHCLGCNRAAALRPRSGRSGSRRPPGSAPAARRQSPCGRCRSRPPCRPHAPARARRSARRSRPCATTGPGSAPAACRVRFGNGGWLTSWPGDPLVEFADIGVGLEVARERRAERHHRAHLVRAATAPAARANIPPRLQPTSSTGAVHRRSRRAACSSSSSVSALAPRLIPSSQGCARQPARASARRSSIVVRSVARKPGMTSAGGPSSGPRGPSGPRPDSKRGRCQATSRTRPQPDGARSSGSNRARRCRRRWSRVPTSCA